MFTRRQLVITAFTTMTVKAAAGQSGRRADDPAKALWTALKKKLSSEEGEEYFETHVFHTILPALKGVVASAIVNPGVSKIVLAMSDTSTPEVTLIVHEGTRKVKSQPYAGAAIEFASGEAVEFSRNPFMLTFDVVIQKVRGLDTE
jgi:hypothetical protein